MPGFVGDDLVAALVDFAFWLDKVFAFPVPFAGVAAKAPWVLSRPTKPRHPTNLTQPMNPTNPTNLAEPIRALAACDLFGALQDRAAKIRVVARNMTNYGTAVTGW